MESEEQEWIEAADGWGTTKEEHEENENGGSAVLDLFGNNDPKQSFSYRIGETKIIHLHGYKLDSDQVDHSTGVTLWQAAPRVRMYKATGVHFPFLSDCSQQYVPCANQTAC